MHENHEGYPISTQLHYFLMVDISLEPVNLFLQHGLAYVLEKFAFELGVWSMLEGIELQTFVYFVQLTEFICSGPFAVEFFQKLFSEFMLPDPQVSLCLQGQVEEG